MKYTQKATELAKKAQTWLNQEHPTYGDGVWSVEFILEIMHGKHLTHSNRRTVLMSLAFTA